VLEALTRGGVPTVLFVEPPTADVLARYPDVRAVGVAGQTRTMTTDEMEASLPSAFASLLELRPRFVHYKLCSTFDSSPQIGSIGRAIDIGCRIFQNRVIPLVVGAPALARFCVFGNLFARSGLDSPPFRLDRHPTMREHPVTPMTEADLRLHLAQQTARPVRLIDVLAVEQGADQVRARLAEAAAGEIVLIDALTERHLATIGTALWELQEREGLPLFVAGSSGVEYALTRDWQDGGISAPPSLTPPEPVDRTIVVSGSCSPVTVRQIAWAVAHGFAELPLDTVRLASSESLEAQVLAIAKRVQTEHDAGRSVIVHTGRGIRASVASKFGEILGRTLREALRTCRVRRVAVAGGDTSGDVGRTLGIEVLEMSAPLAPGAPLCRARSRFPEIDGVEFTFKGGQVGRDDFFGAMLRGGDAKAD
jgi:uncharacterized protein YgbK (DUF1537 family)